VTAEYRLSPPLIERIAGDGVDPARIEDLRGERFESELALMEALAERTDLSYQERFETARLAKVESAAGADDHLIGAEAAMKAGAGLLTAAAPPTAHPRHPGSSASTAAAAAAGAAAAAQGPSATGRGR